MANALRNIKTNDQREKDTVATFILFCEDGVIEPTYFHSFEIANKLKVITNPKQGQSIQNVMNAIMYCILDGKAVPEEGSHKIISENIWCVFDRDTNKGQPNVKDKEDIEFSQAIKMGQQSGINVAWSNDAFELWVLLHFENVSINQSLDKDNIYLRLTEVFKELDNKSLNLVATTGRDNFSYRYNLKNYHSFPLHVLPFLKENDRRNLAITRASQLLTNFAADVPFHHRNPCTMVHILVEELLKYADDSSV